MNSDCFFIGTDLLSGEMDGVYHKIFTTEIQRHGDFNSQCLRVSESVLKVFFCSFKMRGMRSLAHSATLENVAYAQGG
jgi:hypothetical protein